MMKLAVHHSIYHQYFVIICRNSHKVEFSVDILCCDFFGDFYNVPKKNADSWRILLSAQRKVKAVPFFEINPALQPCPACPWKSSGITQWTRLETDDYICNRKFKQVLLGERGLWAGDETLHWGLVPDWLQLFPGHPAGQMGSALAGAGTTQCWASAVWAGETYVSIKVADVIQICLYPYWYLVANVILV